MLIKVKNPQLYQAWCHYLERRHGDLTHRERTIAFRNSEQGLNVPLF